MLWGRIRRSPEKRGSSESGIWRADAKAGLVLTLGRQLPSRPRAGWAGGLGVGLNYAQKHPGKARTPAVRGLESSHEVGVRCCGASTQGLGSRFPQLREGRGLRKAPKRLWAEEAGPHALCSLACPCPQVSHLPSLGHCSRRAPAVFPGSSLKELLVSPCSQKSVQAERPLGPLGEPPVCQARARSLSSGVNWAGAMVSGGPAQPWKEISDLTLSGTRVGAGVGTPGRPGQLRVGAGATKHGPRAGVGPAY